MKIKLTRTCQAIIVCTATMLVQAGPVGAQGTAFTYQGRLNNNGVLAGGNYDLRFTIYDSGGGPTVVAGPLTNSAVAVSNGLFVATLDFSTNVFTGPARWLEIAVRTNGIGSFTALSPRQALTPSPYAIFANTASNVVSGSVVKSLNNLKDNVTLAAGANVTLTPSGNTVTIASAGAGGSGIWNLNGVNTYYNAGNVGIGTTTPFSRLAVQTASGNYGFTHTDGTITLGSYVGSSSSGATGGWLGTYSAHPLYFFVNNGQPSLTIGAGGVTTMTPLGGYGSTYFGTPNGESGMSIAGANRADVRFDGSSLKLLAGFGTGAMPSENGIAITTEGNVGIGTTDPLTGFKLDVIGSTHMDPGGSGGEILFHTPGGETGMSIVGTSRADLRFDGTSVKLLAGFGSGAMPSENGIAVTTSGNVGIGTTSPTAKLTVAGGANQARDKGGFVKAMVFVNQDGTIARCYNGITDSSSGITAIHDISPGSYFVTFNFQVNDRFVSVTPRTPFAIHTGVTAGFRFEDGTTNQVHVQTYVTDVQSDGDDMPFMLIVY
jgi:hypothetical protein